VTEAVQAVNEMSDEVREVVDAWNALGAALQSAGRRLADQTAALTEWEQADGYRALLRALHNQLGRFEVDRDRPELVPFNGWRQKLFMDNPDFLYWVADLNPDRRYRVRGNAGDAAYVSLTAYQSEGGEVRAVERLDTDTIGLDASGGYDVTIGGPPGRPISLWVRHFHGDVRNERTGACTIEPLEAVPAPRPIEPGRFAHQLRRLATTIDSLVPVFAAAAKADAAQPNALRSWSEMTGGAVYTEPGISYLRGGWQLEDGEALVIEGETPRCRYWNILLYSRFLNSLDHRHRKVSATGTTAKVVDGRYRFVLAAQDPGMGSADWLDTEGRPFGIVVMRFLRPDSEPKVPAVRRVRVSELRSGR
jgi:hypothetical protein